MLYEDYKKSRDLAWEILLQQHVTKLPVMIGELCKNMGVKVLYYTPTDQNDGASTIVNHQPHIYVAKDCLPTRQRFTVAHELGHILLGHVGEFDLVNREPSATDNPIEQAANVFASRLLAPACVLAALHMTAPEQIAELCGISYTAAKYRAERMGALYQRDSFYRSDLEQQVYRQFIPFILKTKLKRLLR